MAMLSQFHAKKKLDELSKRGSNMWCFDCAREPASYVNISCGTFVCLRCSGLLRELGFKCKGINTSIFDRNEVDFLGEYGGNDQQGKVWMGNDRSKAVQALSDSTDDETRLRGYLLRKYQAKEFYDSEAEADLIKSKRLIHQRARERDRADTDPSQDQGPDSASSAVALSPVLISAPPASTRTRTRSGSGRARSRTDSLTEGMGSPSPSTSPNSSPSGVETSPMTSAAQRKKPSEFVSSGLRHASSTCNGGIGSSASSTGAEDLSDDVATTTNNFDQVLHISSDSTSSQFQRQQQQQQLQQQAGQTAMEKETQGESKVEQIDTADGEVLTRADLERKIQKFYQKHNPEKLGNIRVFVEWVLYYGLEAFNEKLDAKYGAHIPTSKKKKNKKSRGAREETEAQTQSQTQSQAGPQALSQAEPQAQAQAQAQPQETETDSSVSRMAMSKPKPRDSIVAEAARLEAAEMSNSSGLVNPFPQPAALQQKYHNQGRGQQQHEYQQQQYFQDEILCRPRRSSTNPFDDENDAVVGSNVFSSTTTVHAGESQGRSQGQGQDHSAPAVYNYNSMENPFENMHFA